MTLQLGSHGPVVTRWTDVMLKRFKGYALGRDGLPLKNDGYYGLDEQKVQKEYERRTGQIQDGVVSDHDLEALGVQVMPVRHTIFTVNGFMGDMWVSYPAVCAQSLDPNRVYWQPIGYPNTNVLMADGIKAGVAELINQINLHPGTFMGAFYSEGEIVGALVLDEIRNGSLQHRKDDFIGAVTFGAPMREKGSHPPGCPDPGGRGIARDRTVSTPSWWWDYADPGDMYACCPDDASGEMITSVYQAVARSNVIGGHDTLAEQMLELLLNPVGEAIPLIKSIIKAIGFFGGGTAGHVHYHDREILPGITYLQHAINHLNERAWAVAPRK